MSESIERMWGVRDALLNWLYIEKSRGNKQPVLSASAITEAVEWSGAEITDEEAADASNWLFKAKFIEGPQAWGGGVVRPRITAKGELAADSGRSVRDGEAQANSTSYVFHSSTVGNLANNSPGTEQNYTQNNLYVQKALEVATALDVAAVDPDAAPEGVQGASELAETIRAEASSAEPNRTRLRELVFKAGTSAAAALGSAVGSDIAVLASNALGSFG